MTDLREQFAGLRAGENARIRPPGAAAARETVRRRTRRRRSVAAGLAAIAVAGGFAVARTPGTGGWSDSPEPDPGLSVLLASAQQQIAGVDAESPIASVAAVLTEPFSMDPQPVAVGDYSMATTCAGLGSVLLTSIVRPSGGGAETVVSRAMVRCDEGTPDLLAYRVKVPVPGTLSVRVDPNEDSLGRAAVAFVVQSGLPKGPGGLTAMAARRLGTPQTGPAPQREEPVYATGKVIKKDLLMARAATLQRGTYRFVAACADTGSIEWRMRIESADGADRTLASGSVSCHALKPVTTSIVVDSVGLVRVYLQPDAAAVTARAGWAFQIVTVG